MSIEIHGVVDYSILLFQPKNLTFFLFLFSSPSLKKTNQKKNPSPFPTYLPSYFSFFSSTMKILLTPHCLAAPLLHIQPVSSNIHSSSFIPNLKKRHKNIKAINTTTSPSLRFLVSITVMRKHLSQKHEKTFFLKTLRLLPIHIQL